MKNKLSDFNRGLLIFTLSLTFVFTMRAIIDLAPKKVEAGSITDTVVEKKIYTHEASTTRAAVTFMLIGEQHVYIVSLPVYNSTMPGDTVTFKYNRGPYKSYSPTPPDILIYHV